MVCILLSAASEVEVLPKDTSPYDVFQGPVHFSAVKRGWQVAWSASAYNLLEVNDFATRLVGNTIKGDAVLLSGEHAAGRQTEEQMLEALLHSKVFRMVQPNCPQNRRQRQPSIRSVQQEPHSNQDAPRHDSLDTLRKGTCSFHHIAAANSTRQRILSSKSASRPDWPAAGGGHSSCSTQAEGSSAAEHDNSSRCCLSRPPQRHRILAAAAKQCPAPCFTGQLQPTLHDGNFLVGNNLLPAMVAGEAHATHVEHGMSGNQSGESSSCSQQQQQQQSPSKVCNHLKEGGNLTCMPCSSGIANERHSTLDALCTLSECEQSSDSTSDSSNCCVPGAIVGMVERPPVQGGRVDCNNSISVGNDTPHCPGCVSSMPPVVFDRDAAAVPAWEVQGGPDPPASVSVSSSSTTTTTAVPTASTCAHWGDLAVEVVACIAGYLGRMVSDVMPLYLTCSTWRRAILEDDQLLRQLLFQMDVSRPFKGQKTPMQLQRLPAALTQQLRRMTSSGQHPALLMRAAKLGNVSALVSCARLLDSCGSAEEAVRCWRRAAKAGHLEGQLVYGLALYRGNAGLAQDAEDAYMWLLRALKQVQSSAASGGDIDSALRSRVLAESGLCLGFMVFDGEGVKADRSEAVKYFRLAATAGCKEAEQVLGWMYNTGQF